jgi:hypothetical protein
MIGPSTRPSLLVITSKTNFNDALALYQAGPHNSDGCNRDDITRILEGNKDGTLGSLAAGTSLVM